MNALFSLFIFLPIIVIFWMLCIWCGYLLFNEMRSSNDELKEYCFNRYMRCINEQIKEINRKIKLDDIERNK